MKFLRTDKRTRSLSRGKLGNRVIVDLTRKILHLT